MEIRLNNITLADDVNSIVSKILVNGTYLVQKADFFRAAQADFFARGNKGIRLEVHITHAQDTAAAGESFTLTHQSTLPESGDLTLTTGDAHENRIVCSLNQAVLESVTTHSQQSCSHAIYLFRGRALTATGQIDPINGGGYDGGDYGSAAQGSIDGGLYTDALIPASLNIDGGNYA